MIQDGCCSWCYNSKYVFPTFYSFQGRYNYNCLAKEWKMYGLTSLSSSPELIATNTCVGSTYCYPFVGTYYCGNNDWGTFAVHGASKSFRYFRIESKTPLCPGSYRVDMRGFEVFGVLSKDARTTINSHVPRRTICHRSYPARHIPLYLALRFGLSLFTIK